MPGVTCPNCKWADSFKAQLCPKCLTPLIDTAFPGTGQIETYTIIRYPPTGFEDQAPYVIAIIGLDNGPKVIGRMQASPEAIHIGKRVRFAREVEGALEFVPD